MSVKFTEHLSEPWFSLVKVGLKRVEGRLYKGRFKDLKIGDVIEFMNYDFRPRKFCVKIMRKTSYNNFGEYLFHEGIDKCLPGMEDDITNAISVYYKYYTKEQEDEYGVVAFELQKY